MKHTYKKCRSCKEKDQENCKYCPGGLIYCTTCGGTIGYLTTHCCGHLLPIQILKAVDKGGLDYIDGRWVVYEFSCESCLYRKAIRKGVYTHCKAPVAGRPICTRYRFDHKTKPSS